MKTTRPLAIDLYCGLGGWSEALLAEGWEVVGFDIERHRYPARTLSSSPEGRKVGPDGVDFNNPAIGSSRNRSFNYANECLVRDAPLTGGWMEYPSQLVVQDVLTLHGSQFKDAALIVASPPCQEYSYMAMPWTRAKAKAAAIRADTTGRALADLNRLFEACFRIQREASEAASRHIPMVVENVRGAQPWVGRARWNFGSFYLWGDVPALMPATTGRVAKVQVTEWRDPGPGHDRRRHDEVKDEDGLWHNRSGQKVPGFRFDGNGGSFQTASVETHGIKAPGMNWSNPFQSASVDGLKGVGPAWDAANGCSTHGMKRWTNPAEGTKCGGDWFNAEQPSISRLTNSKSAARKAASAMIAKIPEPLARHIAATFRPAAEPIP